MRLSPEYEAAVKLGYITQADAEKEMRDSVDFGIHSDDVLQRKAFLAGFLWLNFLNKWDVTDHDAELARDAWVRFCNREFSENP